MTDALPSPVKAEPRLPIEVCERVIEAVYNDFYACALVCRAWRARAQRVLFQYVLLQDKDALYRFAELLHASPELGSYVRTLRMRGYLHMPYSPAVLFLTALRGRLTNLAALHIDGFDDAEKAANLLPEGEKELPFLPFHRYFPSLLGSISHINRLSLVNGRLGCSRPGSSLYGGLQVLRLAEDVPHDQTLESLRDTIVSWLPSSDDVVGDPSPSQRYLYLRPWDRRCFTREKCVELLRAIGLVAEEVLCRKGTAAEPGDPEDGAGEDTKDHTEINPCRAILVVQDLGDRLEWGEWWKAAMAECFPTLSRWKWLYVFPTDTVHTKCHWEDHDLTLQDYADRRISWRLAAAT